MPREYFDVSAAVQPRTLWDDAAFAAALAERTLPGPAMTGACPKNDGLVPVIIVFSADVYGLDEQRGGLGDSI